MSKCRYDLSEDCHNKDCLNCVLDKIRAEILRLDYDVENIDYDYNDMAQTEEVHMICREEVLQIIDKYRERYYKEHADDYYLRAESED